MSPLQNDKLTRLVVSPVSLSSSVVECTVTIVEKIKGQIFHFFKILTLHAYRMCSTVRYAHTISYDYYSLAVVTFETFFILIICSNIVIIFL